MTVVEQMHSMIALKNKYPETRVVLIEAAATGVPIKKMLENKLTGIIAIPPKEYGVSKEQRVDACSAEFEAGNVYFPHESIAPWIKPMIEELLLFPKAAHDDTVDACAQALNWLATKKTAVYIEPTITLETYNHTPSHARSIYQEYAPRATVREIRNIFN
jgi:predicted phage terminase large subunit-like protein